MVTPSTSRVDETASYAGDEELVINLQLDNGVEFFLALFEHTVKLLRLGHRTRETIEYKTGVVLMLQLKYSYSNDTNPFLQALLFSSWSLIMPTTMSSETRAPWSIIFFASRPSCVLAAIWSRNMSPVAKWHIQNSSRIRGACVPFP